MTSNALFFLYSFFSNSSNSFNILFVSNILFVPSLKKSSGEILKISHNANIISFFIFSVPYSYFCNVGIEIPSLSANSRCVILFSILKFFNFSFNFILNQPLLCYLFYYIINKIIVNT